MAEAYESSNDESSSTENQASDSVGGGVVVYGNDDSTTLATPASVKGAVQDHLEDQTKVDPSKQKQYLLMLARGLKDSSVKGEVDLSKVDPFLTALQHNVIKKSNINLSKQLLADEIQRRAPERKLDIKNNSVSKLFAILQEYPLEDPVDISFVLRETKAFIDTIKKATKDKIDCKAQANSSSGERQLPSDRLCYILAIVHFPEIREAYEKSQNTKTRQELDAARSVEVACLDFHDLILLYYHKRLAY